MNPPNPPVLLHQRMNALTSPRPTKHKRGKVKTSPPNTIPKRPRSSFLLRTIPGTPDAPVQTNPPLQPTSSSSSSSERCPEYTPNDGWWWHRRRLNLPWPLLPSVQQTPTWTWTRRIERWSGSPSSVHRRRISTTEGQIDNINDRITLTRHTNWHHQSILDSSSSVKF